ncbi:MAG: helix-turn-helix domain-containing protein [Acidimicrobiia bacterium]|nr:helix-turn-helix domain-containing protein [Acidimicrobiia bacterium]
MPAKTEQGWTTARTLEALRRYYGWSVQELARRAGMSRSAVDARKRGETAVDVDDLERYAVAFGVPVTLLLEPASDAIRWVLDNEPAPGWYAARDSNPEPAD